ncbi:MAG: signal peptidase [Planctomycetes bacterium]|nr:signal peptidase [Planctomycetota bacterium]
MSNSPTAKPKQAKHKKYMLVRHGRMNTLGLFEHNESKIPRVPTRVIVKTEKGLELGFLVGQNCPYRGGHFKFDSDQLKEYYNNSDIDFSSAPAGRVIRIATDTDVSEERHLAKIAKEEMQYCRKLVEEMKLEMNVVDVEHIFGGERIIFYFMAENRVDFRELVKKIAHEYQTRIEMRQIGSRDEAKILCDIESCGQQCCCQRFLQALKPVNMRMAKMQKATLDPSKISGYCGRLKCCLRFEDKTYTELKKNLPRKNARVETPQGEGKVLDSQILTQLVMVSFADGKRAAFGVDEITVIPGKPEPRKKHSAARNGNPDKARGNRDTGRNGKDRAQDPKDNGGEADNKPNVSVAQSDEQQTNEPDSGSIDSGEQESSNKD